MTYGFIGAGNLAYAIVKGAIRSEKIENSSIHVYDVSEDAMNKFQSEFGVNKGSSAIEIAEKCNVIFLTVKPKIIPTVLSEIKETVKKTGSVLVSAAAGVTLSQLGQVLGETFPVIRIMPNLNAAVCETITSVCPNKYTSKEHLSKAEAFLNSVGKTVMIPEELFSEFCAIAGCSPAFTYLFIDSLAKGAHKNGMNKKQALKIAAQAVYGSAKMLLESEDHPWELIDAVCSPGGVTIEGVSVLQEYRFESGIVNAVSAAIKKDKNI